MMPPVEYTITIEQIGHELCLFLPVTDTVKYRNSQFYATNHKSHQNAMYLTGQDHLNGGCGASPTFLLVPWLLSSWLWRKCIPSFGVDYVNFLKKTR